MGPNVKQCLISLAVLASLAFASAARADTSSVLVFGTTSAKEQTVIAAAITGALKQAQWSVIDLPYSPKEISDIVACLDGQRPWPCIEPFAKAKGIGKLVLVQAAPEKTGGIRLIGQIVLSSESVPQIEQRYCNPCSDSSLARTSAELAKLLSDHANANTAVPPPSVTGVQIHPTPATAIVMLDDHAVSATAVVPSTVGKHQLSIQLAGYKSVTREIDVVDGKTTVIDETLVPEDHGDPGTTRPSRLIPGLVIAGGAVALVVGSVISWTAEPDANEQRHEYYYSAPGLVLAGAGVLAILGGGYFFFHQPSQPSSGPTVSLTSGGAIGGWTARF